MAVRRSARILLHNAKKLSRFLSPGVARRMKRSVPKARRRCGVFPFTGAGITLPWRLLEPFNNPKIDLAAALRSGWKPLEPASFASSLQAHVECWRSEGRSAVWLHLPAALGAYIPHAVSLGFSLHHAVEQQVVLCQWLAGDKVSKLPAYSSHQVGVAGLVLWEEHHTVLAVKDRLKPQRWKFPGGLSDFGEGISSTAVREVLEETGIETEFQSILAFRQMHNMPAFGNSDLYFVCRMKPLTFDIEYCRDECSDCRWLPLSNFVSDPDFTHFSRRVAQLALKGLAEGWGTVDIAPTSLPLEVGRGQSTHYQLWHRSL